MEHPQIRSSRPDATGTAYSYHRSSVLYIVRTLACLSCTSLHGLEGPGPVHVFHVCMLYFVLCSGRFVGFYGLCGLRRALGIWHLAFWPLLGYWAACGKQMGAQVPIIIIIIPQYRTAHVHVQTPDYPASQSGDDGWEDQARPGPSLSFPCSPPSPSPCLLTSLAE